MNKFITKISSIVLLAFCLPVFSMAITYDFRKATWGMSMEQVIESEGADPVKEGVSILDTPYIAYMLKMKVGETNHDLFAAYYFIEDQLYFAKYYVNTKHSNSNDFLTDFDEFRNVLLQKYGEPKEEETVWKDELYKDKRERWGLAIETGKMEKYTLWETDSTTIMLRLTGDNYKINFEIRYETKDEHLLGLEEQQKTKQEQNSF